MFKRVYVEITNICNLKCPFCHGTKRAPQCLSPAELACVMKKLEGMTRYVYFHVLGEPLLHPQLGELLHIAAEAGMNCCITTNGTLLKRSADTLLNAERLYKLSVSLHSFEANGVKGSLRSYLEDVWSVCERLAENGTVCALRLWNAGGADKLNGEILEFLREKTAPEKLSPHGNGFRLKENIYLENAAKFDWPDLAARKREVQFCHGLRDQIAILCDGTVVPCCLDADGSIALGNIFTQDLRDILNGSRARAMYEGFCARKPTEELCRRCGYATRFNR